MDNFLETYSLPKLNQEETDQLNRLISRNEIEYVIKKKHSKQTNEAFHRKETHGLGEETFGCQEGGERVG